jgi:hypothetical protein
MLKSSAIKPVVTASTRMTVTDTTGQSFGTYDTLAEATQRPRQIEMFTHLPGRRGMSRRARRG